MCCCIGRRSIDGGRLLPAAECMPGRPGGGPAEKVGIELGGIDMGIEGAGPPDGATPPGGDAAVPAAAR